MLIHIHYILFMGHVQSSNKIISHFEVATTKVTTCRCDQNDNKTITITFGVKNGPCETLPTFDDVYLVLGIPDMNHCSGAMSFAFHAI